MKAGRVLELIVRREHLGPAFLAEAGLRDTIELVSLDDGEVVRFWELAPAEASRLLRTLRGDLARLEAEAFMARWGGDDAGRR